MSLGYYATFWLHTTHTAGFLQVIWLRWFAVSGAIRLVGTDVFVNHIFLYISPCDSRPIILPLTFSNCYLPRFRFFGGFIPIKVVWVEFYVNSLFYIDCVSRIISFDKLYFIPQWFVSGIDGMFCGESQTLSALVFSSLLLHVRPVPPMHAWPLSHLRGLFGLIRRAFNVVTDLKTART